MVDKQRFWASRFDINMNAAHDRGEAKGKASFSLDTDIRQLFKDHVFGTFIEDHAGLRLLDIIGEDNVMLECDYPHSDSTWPDTVEPGPQVAGRPARGRPAQDHRRQRLSGLRLHAGRPRGPLRGECMKVVVDPDVCQGHARCWEICPDVFALDEAGHAVVSSPDVPAEFEEAVDEAVANCPERAIEVS